MKEIISYWGVELRKVRERTVFHDILENSQPKSFTIPHPSHLTLILHGKS